MILTTKADEHDGDNTLPSYSREDYKGPAQGDDKESRSSFESESGLPRAGPSNLNVPALYSEQASAGASGSASYYAPYLAGFTPGYATSPGPIDRPVEAPLSFSRPRAQGLPYNAFKPIFLVARGKSLSKGFPMTPPPLHENPHPFVTHDVNENDWLLFLKDVHTAGSLTEKDRKRSHLPILSWVPFVNELSAYGVQKFMKSRKLEVVVRVIDTWNHHFFLPRKMRIVLMKGTEKLSGLNEHIIGDLHTPIPSNNTPGMANEAIAASSNGKAKGKAKEDVDDIFRLFIVPV